MKIGDKVMILRGPYRDRWGIVIDDLYRQRDDGSQTVLIQLKDKELEFNLEDVNTDDG